MNSSTEHIVALQQAQQPSMISIPKSEYQNLKSTILLLQDQLADLKRMIFGSKSEKFIPSADNQLGLFGQIPNLETMHLSPNILVFTELKRIKRRNNLFDAQLLLIFLG